MNKTATVQVTRTILLIGITLGITTLVTALADNPSPVGWNLSGGGFCARTYRIFNTTLTPSPGIYAQNCSTGKNDYYNATDAGFLINKALLACFPTTTFSFCNMGVSGGVYNVFTPINLFQKSSSGGILFEGDGAGEYYNTPGGNGTTLRAMTNGMTVVKFCASPPCPAGWHQNAYLRNFAVDGNGLAAIGIDDSMVETVTFDRMVSIVLENRFTVTDFTTAMIMDGNEDAILTAMVFVGDGTAVHGSAITDLRWGDTGGNIEIRDSFFGGQLNLLACGQNAVISGTTISSFKMSTIDCPSPSGNQGTMWSLVFEGDYIANAQGPGRINLNGQTIGNIYFSGNLLLTNSNQPMYFGTGTITLSSFCGNTFHNPAGASNWNVNSATLTEQKTCGNNLMSGTTPTGFPAGTFPNLGTPDGNGVF